MKSTAKAHEVGFDDRTAFGVRSSRLTPRDEAQGLHGKRSAELFSRHTILPELALYLPPISQRIQILQEATLLHREIRELRVIRGRLISMSKATPESAVRCDGRWGALRLERLSGEMEGGVLWALGWDWERGKWRCSSPLGYRRCGGG